MTGRLPPLAITLAAVATAAAGGWVIVQGSGPPDPTTAPLPDTVTWSRDVAPLLGEACVVCHSEGGSAPFVLETYDDVRRRADRILEATEAGVMPPWLPGGEHGRFEGDRRLAARSVELLRRWVDLGLPEGDAGVRAEPRGQVSVDLGPADLVVALPTYTMPAEGRDVYRNLVVPIPVEEDRWVESIELVPGRGGVVHHARLMVDTTSSSRLLDSEDPAPGFDGMELRSNAGDPDGHFVGWTPGKSRLPPLEGMAWRVTPGTDLVAQLHMRTTGEVEEVDARVEFRFAESPPTRAPAILVISSLMIDIPAGESEYRTTNSFTLPVDVEVLSVYPHAHYLGKRLRATALLPGGEEVELIDIPEWDFDWQDDYRFAEPVSLPAGTTILKEYTFDNSANNEHNPANPPRRVVYGSNSDDEMADLILQVLPESLADRAALLEAQAWQHASEDMAYLAHAAFVAGRTAAERGELDEAVRHFQSALSYRSDHLGALTGLSMAFVARADGASALLIARQAIAVSGEADPGAFDALAAALALQGDRGGARAAAAQGLRLAEASGDTEVEQRLRRRLASLGG